MNSEILGRLAAAVRDMDSEAVVALVNDSLEMGITPVEVIHDGLARGMEEAGVLFEKKEYFIPEILLCSDAMQAGLAVLAPHLVHDEGKEGETIVIGVVEGDIHDIGKNLVKMMLEVAGYQVIDLGRDVPAPAFVEAVRETQARFVCLSTLMSTTMRQMENVIEQLLAEKLPYQLKIMVGGGPVSQDYADRIGASYAENAIEAVKLIRYLQKESGH
ncbi:MAG: cobalamin-binding protein [Syntrophomonadaceae bacterium]|nr:cobalamin-binding protein [Syntrophomonadaceae bacterium]